MSISIVIPSLGRKDELYNTINDLSKQSLPKENWEVIVVLQNELDFEKFNLLCERTGINLRVYYSSAPNASLARNIGLIESKSDIVLFLDDDLVIENSDFLNSHITAYSDYSISGVFGQILDPGMSPRSDRHKWSYKKHIGWLFFPSNYDKQCYLENGTSANLSVRREKALDIGGMDIFFEKGAHREESDFCLRLTKKHGLIKFMPEASVIHLGAKHGGCRNWGKNEGVRPVHHVFGEWYFILKGLKIGTVKWYQLHYHLGVLFFRQIWNVYNRKSIGALFKATGRSFKGFFKALSASIKYKKNDLSLLPSEYNYDIVFEHEN